MKRLAIIFGAVVLGGVMLVVAFIVIIEVQSRRSLRQLQQVVAQLAPPTAFTTVLQRLGNPNQSHTNADVIALYGTRKDESFITNTVLHMFSHRGPPYRWILIYTDRESERVLYADWHHM
jgi:hypothetical protein